MTFVSIVNVYGVSKLVNVTFPPTELHWPKLSKKRKNTYFIHVPRKSKLLLKEKYLIINFPNYPVKQKVFIYYIILYYTMKFHKKLIIRTSSVV